MNLMFDDPFSHELANELPYSYVDIHEALRVLAEAGADALTARDLLRKAAAEGVNFATEVAYTYAARAPWSGGHGRLMQSVLYGTSAAPAPEGSLEDELDAEIERRRRRAYELDEDGA